MAPKKMADGAGYGTLQGEDGELCAPGQDMMKGLGRLIFVRRKLNPIELMGIQGKNTYVYYHSTDRDGKPSSGVATEESTCIDRQLWCGGRKATFTVWRGNDGDAQKNGVVAFKVEKPQHCICCPCFKPSTAEVTDGGGGKLGTIMQPWHPCKYRTIALDAQGKQRFASDVWACAGGIVCPCLCDANFDFHDAGHPEDRGHINRKALSCKEMFCPVNRYEIAVPAKSSLADRALLIAQQILLDVVYFGNGSEDDAAALV